MFFILDLLILDNLLFFNNLPFFYGLNLVYWYLFFYILASINRNLLIVFFNFFLNLWNFIYDFLVMLQLNSNSFYALLRIIYWTQFIKLGWLIWAWVASYLCIIGENVILIYFGHFYKSLLFNLTGALSYNTWVRWNLFLSLSYIFIIDIFHIWIFTNRWLQWSFNITIIVIFHLFFNCCYFSNISVTGSALSLKLHIL